MNEHRFKLKKDGKTVGYLKYDKYRPDCNGDLDVYGKFIGDGDDKWCEGVTPEFDAMYPFVTKDKNGNDVFAGDSVKFGKRILTIVWDNCDMQWKTKQPGRTPAAEYYLPDTPLCQWAISEQFELIIEDEKNEN